MSSVASFEDLWCVFERRSGNLVDALEVVDIPGEPLILADRAVFLADCKLVKDMAVTFPPPGDEAVRARAEAVGAFKVPAHLGITEEEWTTV